MRWILFGVLFLGTVAFAFAQRRGSCASCSPATNLDCGPDGCVPTQFIPQGTPKKPAIEGGYTWQQYPADRDAYSLWFGKVQLGAWRVSTQKYKALLDWDRGEWGLPMEAPIDHLNGVPVTLLEEMIRPVERLHKFEAWQVRGVKVGDLPGPERFALNGVKVSSDDAMGAISKGVIPDDKGKLWLSVWSKEPAIRAKVLSDIKSDPAMSAWVSERCHVWAGDAAHPDHFLTKDRDGKPLYAIDGEPTISLQDTNGVELWHDAGYQQGPPSFDAMRKCDPKYRPDLSRGPKNRVPSIGGIMDIPFVLLAGALGLVLLLKPKRSDVP